MSRLRNPTSIESIPDGATLVHKEMNAGYGAPPMKFTVKLTDV